MSRRIPTLRRVHGQQRRGGQRRAACPYSSGEEKGKGKERKGKGREGTRHPAARHCPRHASCHWRPHSSNSLFLQSSGRDGTVRTEGPETPAQGHGANRREGRGSGMRATVSQFPGRPVGRAGSGASAHARFSHVPSPHSFRPHPATQKHPQHGSQRLKTSLHASGARITVASQKLRAVTACWRRPPVSLKLRRHGHSVLQ